MSRSQPYHYKIDEEDLIASIRRNPNWPVDYASSFKRFQSSDSIPHHHHHRRTQHHHHHRVPPSTNQTFTPRTAVKISSVLAAASKNPRHHLGTFLYSPKISIPDPPASSLRSPGANISVQPNLLPSFRGPEHVNCTYTVRISRTWLRLHIREAITAERALWGTGIYTDDSDPIAACIHAGFVKGAWNDWIDTTLLEQIIAEQNPKIDAAQDNVPEKPVEPPPGKDLHVTLVVLPQLERYVESVRFGIKSRCWPEGKNGAPHDGASFLVWQVEWVDEGMERGRERGGRARRKRLDGGW